MKKESELLFEALDRADKAGNEQDARDLYVMYQDALKQEQQAAQQAEQPAPIEDGLGRQLGLTGRTVINGLTNLGGILYNPIAATANQFLPEGYRLTEADGNPIGDMLGLPRPQTDREKWVAKAGEGAVEALTTGGAGLVRKGVQEATEQAGKQVSNTAKGIIDLTTDRIGTQAASSAAASGAIEATQNSGRGDGVALFNGIVAGLATPAGISKLGQKFMQADNAVSDVTDFVVKTARGQATKPTMSIEQKIDATVRGLVADSGFAWQDLDPALRASLKNEVAQALKVNGIVNEDALARSATIRLAGGTPTRGQVTQDPVFVTRERNAAKLGANSEDPDSNKLAKVFNENNKQYIRNLDDLGAKTLEPWEAAEPLIRNAEDYLDLRKAQISDIYKQAENATGRQALLDSSWFSNEVNKRLDKSRATWAMGDLKDLVNAITLENPQTPLTVDVVDSVKSMLSDIIKSGGKQKKPAIIIRDVLDQTPFRFGEEGGQVALDAANKARKAYRDFNLEIENNRLLKDLVKARETNSTIDPEKFVSKYIIKSTARELEDYLRVLGPEGKQMAKEQILAMIRKQATKSKDEVDMANLKSSSLSSAIDNIGTKKLEMLFEPAEIAKLKATSKAANYLQNQGEGFAVNNSNTASAGLSSIVEWLANSPKLRKIPFGFAVQDPARAFLADSATNTALDIPGIAGRADPTKVNLPYQFPGLLPLFLGDDL